MTNHLTKVRGNSCSYTDKDFFFYIKNGFRRLRDLYLHSTLGMWIRNTQKESHLGSEYSIEQWVLSRVDSSAFTMTVLTCKVFWHFVKRGKVSNDDTDTPYLG